MGAARLLDPEAHAAVGRFGRPALAWEVLRRNPAYRAAYQAWFGKSDGRDTVDPAFTALWGLHFP